MDELELGDYLPLAHKHNHFWRAIKAHLARIGNYLSYDCQHAEKDHPPIKLDINYWYGLSCILFHFVKASCTHFALHKLCSSKLLGMRFQGKFKILHY